MKLSASRSLLGLALSLAMADAREIVPGQIVFFSGTNYEGDQKSVDIEWDNCMEIPDRAKFGVRDTSFRVDGVDRRGDAHCFIYAKYIGDDPAGPICGPDDKYSPKYPFERLPRSGEHNGDLINEDTKWEGFKCVKATKDFI